MNFPPAITLAKNRLATLGDVKRSELLVSLTKGPEHAKMWRELENRLSRRDGDWICAFLDEAVNAQTLPSYYYSTNAERQALSRRIRELSNEICRLYSDNLFDTYLFVDRELVELGFLTEGHSGESAAKDGPLHPIVRISYTKATTYLADRAVLRINEAGADPFTGSQIAGHADAARTFARHFGAGIAKKWGNPEDSAVAIVTNALFDTHYRASDICNQRVRVRRFAIRARKSGVSQFRKKRS